MRRADNMIAELGTSETGDPKMTNTSEKGDNIDELQKEYELLEAAYTGDYQQVTKLLSLGVSVETENLKHLLPDYSLEQCITPLQTAAKCGHIKCVQLLINHGANVNGRNKFGCTALHLAAKKGDYLCLKMLLESGADCRPFISRHFSDVKGTTALHLAIKRNHDECAEELIRFGANCSAVDTMGDTPLHLALKTGMLPCAEELIRLGANCNAADGQGDTPLHLAVKNRMLSCVKALINLGANCNAVNVTGDTPLHFAVEYAMLPCVKELVCAGCDVNSINKVGLSPLHLLCRSLHLCWGEQNENKMEILRYLVLEVNTIDINKTTSLGLTALSLAFENYNFSLIKFLITCGADLNIKEESLYAYLKHELQKPDDDLDGMKYIVECIPTLPGLKSLNLLERIENREVDFFYEREDSISGDDLKFQLVQTETQVYVEMRYEFMTVLRNTKFPLQQPLHSRFIPLHQPLLNLLYEHVIDRLKYMDEDFSDFFSYVDEDELLLLKKRLWYEIMASTPHTLQNLCRFCIRKYMGPTSIKHIRKLPLQEKLISYLLFECDELKDCIQTLQKL